MHECVVCARRGAHTDWNVSRRGECCLPEGFSRIISSASIRSEWRESPHPNSMTTSFVVFLRRCCVGVPSLAFALSCSAFSLSTSSSPPDLRLSLFLFRLARISLHSSSCSYSSLSSSWCRKVCSSLEDESSAECSAELSSSSFTRGEVAAGSSGESRPLITRFSHLRSAFFCSRERPSTHVSWVSLASETFGLICKTKDDQYV